MQFMAMGWRQASLGLADRFWLLAHDSFSWKPRLADPAMGFGLAAALLGEQVFVGNCRIVDHEIRWDRAPRIADSLVQWVAFQLYVADVRAGRPISIARGLELLRGDAYIDVAERLRRLGIVRREQSRRPFRATVHYSVVDTNAGMGPQAHLDSVLFVGPVRQLDDQFLGVLVWATYLTKDVFPDKRDAATLLQHYHQNMPPVHRLIVNFARTGYEAVVAGNAGH